MKVITDAMKSITKTLSACLPGLIAAIMKTKIPAGFSKEKLDLISQSFKVVSDFGGTIGKFVGLSKKKVGKSEVKDMTGLMTDVGSLVDALAGKTGGGKGALNRVFDSVQKMTAKLPTKGLDTVAKKMKIVASAFGVVGDFAGAISSVMALAPESKDPKGFVTEKRLSSILASVSRITTALAAEKTGAMGKIFGAVNRMANQIPTKGRYGFGKKVKIIASMFSGMGSFASAISEVMSIVPDSVDKDGKTKDKTTAVVKLLNDVTPVICKNMSKIGGGIATMLEDSAVKKMVANPGRIKGLKNCKKLTPLETGLPGKAKTGI